MKQSSEIGESGDMYGISLYIINDRGILPKTNHSIIY